jgi:hypothetical protein
VSEAAATEAPDQVDLVPSETEGYRAPGGGIRSSVRDRMAARRPYRSEPVTLDDGTEVEVRTISLGERAEMVAELSDKETGEFDNQRMQAMSVLHQSYDPETGERVFADDDIDFIQSMDASYLQPIIDAANKLATGNKEAQEAEAKKS